jgi:hypothetical protein
MDEKGSERSLPISLFSAQALYASQTKLLLYYPHRRPRDVKRMSPTEHDEWSWLGKLGAGRPAADRTVHV